MEQVNLSRSNLTTRTPPVLVPPFQAKFKTKIDMGFVKRLLGQQKSGGLSRSTQNRLDQMYEAVYPLLRPRVVGEVFPIAVLEKNRIALPSGLSFKSCKMARVMAAAEYLVCFVATVGKEIDEQIDQLMGQGKVANAYICDALGSGAAESVAERFQNGFDRNFLPETSLQASNIRFSPGYCDWPVTEQHKLFSLVDAGAIGVELSPNSLMAPRKSISAVFGLYPKKNGPAPKKHNPCLSCCKKDCIARRSPAETIN